MSMLICANEIIFMIKHITILLSLMTLLSYCVCRISILLLRRSEEHTSELQSQSNLVCRLLLEKKKKQYQHASLEEASQDHDGSLMGTGPSLRHTLQCYDKTYCSTYRLYVRANVVIYVVSTLL